MINPVYSAELDYMYVRSGKPNHPSRYGLTSSQVNHLKKTKKWKKFLAQWSALRSQFYFNKLDQCCVCRDYRTDGVIVLSNRICRRCCEDIKHQLRNPYM